nr:MAG TPA: hypothetical protein [Caudoviricetes sp.]
MPVDPGTLPGLFPVSYQSSIKLVILMPPFIILYSVDKFQTCSRFPL